MKHRRILPLIAAVVLFGAVRSLHSEVKIIANPSMRANSITVGELRSVFLQDTRWLRDGSHVVPVLAKSGAAHEAFLREYIGKSDDGLRTYYRTLVFTGTGFMPKVLSSDVETAAYVAKTKAAIGYVSGDTNTDQVKVLAVTDDATARRTLVTRIEPEYPETLKRRGISGTVRLELTISAKVVVESAAVLGGNPILGEAAVEAVKNWIYSPGAARTLTQVSITFDAKR